MKNGRHQKGEEGSNKGPNTFKNQGGGRLLLYLFHNNLIYFSILQADRGHPGDQCENLAGTQVWSNQHV